ncbi:MAG: radical SAM protein [Candidatus Accumulibacter phosphatis]|jgi:radical SAM protein with 4Fe4S-binding SPASM domain|uniref:radical SAM/SPASM domain-containing protein n=1 Tax=Candidatus Accumulibacter TaxID=327159 RepID=UPI0025BA0F26|nr:radical SAM protein [Candidatus Accumulibacter sp. ACC012]
MTIEFGSTRLLNPLSPPRFAPWPSAVGIELTTRCQLQCRHCCNESGPEQSDELEFALIERTLAEMHSWGVKQVRLSGGEPTLHSQLKQILEACARQAIAVTLNTHGVLADSILATLLESSIARFLVSLDGLEPAHEQIRGRGTFQRSVSTCRRLSVAGRSVALSCHIGRHNLHDVAGLAELAADLGVDLKFSPLRPVGRALAELQDILPRPQDYFGVVKAVSALRMKYPTIRILTDFDILDACQESFAVTHAGTACGAGRVMVNISASGDVYPCAFFVTPDRRFSAGNLHRESLGEIWRSSPVFEPFRVHSKAPECQSCAHYRNRCAGGCPAIGHFRRGALDALDPTCFAHLVENDS